MSVHELVEALDLEPHPEGGWYRQTFRAEETVTTPRGERAAATLIVFLLPAGESSAWHRVASSEIWMWAGLREIALQYGGGGDAPVAGEVVVLGDAGAGKATQAIIPASVWQRTLPAEHDALAQCLVSPGFDFDDFELEPSP
ncbi:cupin domain-containing protein [Galbitalea sp. SE-J8]|uniref:cupin domain-containing protein n=1 Tax=Galbitalea sp. SE-J8 TaxID=3054952 RepID=UPI00259C6FB8|nr:cupin domain-containing protein [Galbitalea sp. SE-J8]MDM4763052.1 cupin domain-containing protein [Galbitalea sp. SE-J8]